MVMVIIMIMMNNYNENDNDMRNVLQIKRPLNWQKYMRTTGIKNV